MSSAAISDNLTTKIYSYKGTPAQYLFCLSDSQIDPW